MSSPSFSYKFFSQFEKISEDIKLILWEETLGSLTELTEFFRFKHDWFSILDLDESEELLQRYYIDILGEHNVWE